MKTHADFMRFFFQNRTLEQRILREHIFASFWMQLWYAEAFDLIGPGANNLLFLKKSYILIT